MARPALVIGVGGAGQYVLTFLKKDLLEIGNGRVPKEVKLLSFDTLKHPAAVAGHDQDKSPKTQEKRQKKAGAVELTDKIEYIHVGADLNPLVMQIKDGQMPHLQWIRADTAIATLPEAALKCDDGAGAIRHLGRLCLINDVQTKSTSKITACIASAMSAINQMNKVTVQNRLEVIIVGSLAGGTGSGMLVDTALLCRNLAATAFAGNIVVRGIIITPRAFTQGGINDSSRAMLAYSFAAWRELDRFMITSSEYGGNHVQYSAVDPELTLKSDRRLFDVTYIVDPQRQNNPLASGLPEKGLYPAVANAISAILDDTAGAAYSQQAINLNTTLIGQPRKPLHSTFGAYTMKVPVYYEQMKFTYELAIEALTVLLAPALNGEGRVGNLVDSKNQEVDTSMVGLNAALSFLGGDNTQHKGATFPNTLLGKRIADVRRQNRRDDDVYITRTAASNLPDERKAIVDVQSDARGNTIIQGFNKEMSHSIWQDVAPSIDIGRNPNSQEERNRLENGIVNSRAKHLGAANAAAGNRGALGEELEDAKWAQVRLFGARLAAFTEATLNGTSSNPVAARGGKLGYVLSFYKNLLETFDYYNGFLADVSKARSEKLKKEAGTKRQADSAKEAFFRNPKKNCWVTFWDQNIHPDSHRLQREYLLAENKVNDTLKEIILIEYTTQTIQQMRSIAQAALNDLKKHEVHLAVGKIQTETPPNQSPRTVEYKSLYHTVQEEKDNVETNHQLDRQLNEVSEVIGQQQYISSAQDVQNLLAKLQWRVVPKMAPVHLPDNSVIQQVVGVDTVLSAVDGPTNVDFKKEGETAIQTNLEIITKLAGEPFGAMIATNPPNPFGVAVMNSPETSTSAQLATHLNHMAEPFYLKLNGGVGPIHTPHPRTGLIRVHSNVNGATTQYFSDPTMGFLKNLQDLDKTIFLEPLVESQDNFKLTYVRFDDCITSADFDIWEKCRDAYLGYINDVRSELRPENFHVFPAEIHACRYERKIMDVLRFSYRILDPAIVALLDDDQRIEMFFRAKAFGFIRRKKDPITNNNYWVYQIPDCQEIQLTQPVNTIGGTSEEDYFFLINQFCIKACDIRPERQANYQFMINFDDLKSAIFAFINKTRKDRLQQLIRKEVADPEGIVSELRSYVAARRQAVTNPLMKERTAVAHDDLANLAETIYQIALKNNG
jgi:hypothetical protein